MCASRANPVGPLLRVRGGIPPIVTTSSPTDFVSDKVDLGVQDQTDLLHQAAVGSLIWLRFGSVRFGLVRFGSVRFGS
eukprot:scaffold85807_cov28-Attheya_sp.AAC.1